MPNSTISPAVSELTVHMSAFNRCNGHSACFVLSARLACFRRSEFTADLVTYDVLPPLHANRVLENVARQLNGDVFAPTCKRIHVLSPIKTQWCTTESRKGERRTLALCDVVYGLEIAAAHPLTMLERLNASVALGVAGFEGSLKQADRETFAPTIFPPSSRVDLGWLPVAVTTSPRRTIFQRLEMVGGVIDCEARDMVDRTAE